MASPQPNVKERMVEIIEAQPADSSFDEILRELALARMIEQGLEDVDQGRTVSHEEVRRELDVTLSADEALIEKAREKAEREQTTLDTLFQQWLAQYIDQERRAREYRELMEELSYAQPGRRFTRDELNERR